MKQLIVSALTPDLSGVGLQDVPEPTRGPGQVRVAVRAASLNFPDLLMTRGLYQLKPPLPFALGMEVSGEVLEADAGSGWVPGDAVVCGTRLGGFAEQVVVDARVLRPKPARLSHDEAASVGTAYLTAYVALVRFGRIEPGQWVLVHGASGGVGLAAVDLAHALGARVIATSRSGAKLARIAELYAPAATLTTPDFREQVKALTGGGADLVYDPVGGDTFDESTRCVAFGGTVLVVGFASGRIPSVSVNMPLIKGFAVSGVRAGEYGRQFPDRGRENGDAVWALAGEGRITPHVHASLPLGEWRTAFELMDRGELVGKVVLRPQG